ncbi:uncharacterized protein [Branchiostoma lanceolatum]|uniref:uncharacterized protein n=1 Tax=Branchiostoma lanceolatum TaxID=7740 RepID=UPI0034561AB6
MGKRKEPTHKPVPCGVWVSKKRQKQLLLPQPKRARLSSVTVIPTRPLGGARELPKRQATITEIFSSRGRKDEETAATTSESNSSQVNGTEHCYEKASDPNRLDSTIRLSPESANQQIILKTSDKNFSTAHYRTSTDKSKGKERSDEEEYGYSLTDGSQNDKPLSPLKYTQDFEGNLKLKTPFNLPKTDTNDDVFTKNQTVKNSMSKETLHSKNIQKPQNVTKSCEHVKRQETRVEKTLQLTERHEVLSQPMYTLDTQGDLKTKFGTEHDCPQTLDDQNVGLREKPMLDTMPCTEALSPLKYTLDSQGELMYKDNHPCDGARKGHSEESHSLRCGHSDVDIEDDSLLSEPDVLSQLKYTLDSEGELKCKGN